MRPIQNFFVCLFLLFFSIHVQASVVTIQNVIFVNGINNTISGVVNEAVATAQHLNESGSHRNNKTVFMVQFVYNPMGFYGTVDTFALLQDLKEIAYLKVNEEYSCRYLKDIAIPFAAPDTPILRHSATEVLQRARSVLPADSMLNMPSDSMYLTERVVFSLVDRIDEVPHAVVIAHSEGNLLANIAYAFFAQRFGSGVQKKLRVVNVANTSCVTVSGLGYTHANDGALYKAARTGDTLTLENLGGSDGFNLKRDTPECKNQVCDFILAPPTFAGVHATSNLNHGYIDTYLGTAKTYAIVDQGIPFSPNTTTMREHFVDIVYAATDALQSPVTTPAVVFSDSTRIHQEPQWKWEYDTTPHQRYDTFLLTWAEAGKTERIRPFIPDMNVVEISMRHYMHSSSDTFHPGVSFELVNGEQFALTWQSYVSLTSGGCTPEAYGDKIVLDTKGSGDVSRCFGDSMFRASDYHDRWIYSNMVYNAFTGEFSLSINNVPVLTAVLPQEKRASVRWIYFENGGYGLHAYEYITIISHDN